MLPIFRVLEFDVADENITFTTAEGEEWFTVQQIISPSGLGICESTGCQKLLVIMDDFPCVMLVNMFIDSSGCYTGPLAQFVQN